VKLYPAKSVIPTHLPKPSLIMAKRIVIIEDDTDILELLVYLFENEGYQVSSFTKGREAREISQLMPDVVLLDVNLAGSAKRGDQICSELRKLDLTVPFPVMLLSAEKDLATLAAACMADGYMAKPFDIDNLIAKVEAIQS
jgi:two-component system response regulator VicR